MTHKLSSSDRKSKVVMRKRKKDVRKSSEKLKTKKTCRVDEKEDQGTNKTNIIDVEGAITQIHTTDAMNHNSVELELERAGRHIRTQTLEVATDKDANVGKSCETIETTNETCKVNDEEELKHNNTNEVEGGGTNNTATKEVKVVELEQGQLYTPNDKVDKNTNVGNSSETIEMKKRKAYNIYDVEEQENNHTRVVEVVITQMDNTEVKYPNGVELQHGQADQTSETTEYKDKNIGKSYLAMETKKKTYRVNDTNGEITDINVASVKKSENEENKKHGVYEFSVGKKITKKHMIDHDEDEGFENIQPVNHGDNSEQDEYHPGKEHPKYQERYTPNNIDTKSNLFASLPLTSKTQSAIKNLSYTHMTEVQAKTIPALLTGKDLIASSQTGSGKTLAFVLPIIDLLYKVSFQTRNGTGAIIVTPTRELAIQIHSVIQDLYQQGKHPQTFGLLMGGANRRKEANRLINGVNVLVATPGRLLDHLQNTEGFIIRNLMAFVIDEADRILEHGFEDDLRKILKLLPKKHQTMLFSATITRQITDLVKLSINIRNAVYLNITSETSSPSSMVTRLEQGFVKVPSNQRFILLYTFIHTNYTYKKIMVFFSSCASVQFHAELFNYLDIPVLSLHGKQNQPKRTSTYFQFCKQEKGILFCTDVAARGLDIPEVHWIIQYDPPDDPREYIHRFGRIARGVNNSQSQVQTQTKERALLFLLPEEMGILHYLKKTCNIPIMNEYDVPQPKLKKHINLKLQKIIETNYYLNRASKDAYRGYLLSYASHMHKDIFNVEKLDLKGVGECFGFRSPPRVDLPVFKKMKRTPKTHKNNKY